MYFLFGSDCTFQIPRAAEATRIIGLNFVCLGICWVFFDVDHVRAACVLFDLRTEVILGDHFLCGASLFFPYYCVSFQTQWKMMTSQQS